MIKNFFYLFVLLIPVAINAQNKSVLFNSPDLYYEGRIMYNDSSAVLSWPGTSVTLNFKGSSISAILQDMDTANYYNVIVDNQLVSKFHTGIEKHCYVLASDLKDENHTIQLFKCTEWDKGKTLFFGFELPQKSEILPPSQPKKRKIEFYGNSITCGYAIEENSNDLGIGYFENNYFTYAALTARHFDVQYYCISKSGIGIMVSWFPLIMPEMYDRLDATDSTSRWDFSKYTPDIVVINLFQNDSWLVKMPKNDEFKHRFGTKAPGENFIIASYKNFIASIRSKYPNASIICALGSMDATKEGSKWPGYIQMAVKQLKDPKIYTHFFKFKGSYGHPNVAEQKIMADDLIKFIDKNVKW